MSKIVFGTGFKDSAQRISIEKYNDVVEIRVSDVTGMNDKVTSGEGRFKFYDIIPTETYIYDDGRYRTKNKSYDKYELADYLQRIGEDAKKWVSKVVVRNNNLKLIRFFGFDDDLFFKVFTGDCLQIDHNIVINAREKEVDYIIPGRDVVLKHE